MNTEGTLFTAKLLLESHVKITKIGRARNFARDNHQEIIFYLAVSFRMTYLLATPLEMKKKDPYCESGVNGDFQLLPGFRCRATRFRYFIAH